MSNTQSLLAWVLRMLSGTSLVAGIATVISSTSQVMTAQVSGRGATIFERAIASPELAFEPPALHSAPFIFEQRPDLQAQLLIGMLLILLGFAFYSMWIVRNKRGH